jgi:hypothetical protein
MLSLIDYLSDTYYIPLIQLVLALAAAVIGYIHRRKFKYLRLFPIYAIASAIQTGLVFSCIIFKIHAYIFFGNYSIVIFVIIEFFIFYNLLFQLIKSQHLKTSMRIMQATFSLFLLFMCCNFKFSDAIPSSFTIVNSVFLFIPCLFFFYEIFKLPPSISLINQPPFWIITGFAFMVICTLPFYFLEPFLLNNMFNLYEQIYTLTYVFYCLVFLLICKAFLCTPVTTK